MSVVSGMAIIMLMLTDRQAGASTTWSSSRKGESPSGGGV